MENTDNAPTAELHGDSREDGGHLLCPILHLTSHAHALPLQPAPDLKYDLRSTRNPPKEIRDRHKGTSKRLREHMLSQRGFVDLLSRAEADVLLQMEIRVAQWQAHCQAEIEDKLSEDLQIPNALRNLQAGAKRAADATGDGGENADDAPTLSVGASCARGHHRSVAFVEELSRKSWPKHWQVRVVHRDINQSRRTERRGGGRQSRGSQQSLQYGSD